MKKQVVLTIDSDVLKDAKLYAEKNNASLSAMVEEHLQQLTSRVKRRTIIDMVEELGPSNIDPKADLIKLYYEEKCRGV